MKKFLLIFVLILILTACSSNMANIKVRQPAVAGQFYPADASRLEFKIKEYLDKVKTPSIPLSKGVMAIMVPHAGYDFSGPVAAYSYKQIAGKKYDTVVIIGNSHSAYFDGIAIDGSDAWQTPLGEVEIDKDLANKLISADSTIKSDGSAHAEEHSLEVQLPFLQKALAPGFKIVPLLFGNSKDDSYKKLAQALKDSLGENDLVVISTDLSHYPAYADANKIDQQTLEIIKTSDVAKLNEHINKTISANIPAEDTLICGLDGVKTVMELANLAGWNKIEILHYANSGDTAIGDKKRVVGYGAVAFAQVESLSADQEGLKLKVESNNELNLEQKKILLDITKQTVASYVREKKIPEFNITDQYLQKKQGAFVTLKKDSELRGCIGQIVPSDKPLWEVVREMAVASASADPRFDPVSPAELSELDYEVSVLSAPEKINNWQEIKLGVHGVIIERGWQKGVFLPQVASETGWNLEKFMSELCAQKAGLPADCYKNDSEVIIKIFSAQVFSDQDIK